MFVCFLNIMEICVGGGGSRCWVYTIIGGASTLALNKYWLRHTGMLAYMGQPQQ